MQTMNTERNPTTTSSAELGSRRAMDDNLQQLPVTTTASEQTKGESKEHFYENREGNYVEMSPAASAIYEEEEHVYEDIGAPSLGKIKSILF